MNIYKGIGGGIAGLATTLAAVTTVFAATTILVSGNTAMAENEPGWLFNRDVSTSTPYEFVAGNASIGSGSLYVMPIGATPSNKFVGENFLNAKMADVDSISYDFKIGAGGSTSDANQFYMNVYANFGESDDLKYYDCRYNIVPTTGSLTSFTTVMFDPTQAYPVTQRNSSPHTCPVIPANMDLVSPGSNIRMFALNVGDTSASDVDLDGYLDNVVVVQDGETTTYDFEPVLRPTTKDQCKKDGWMLFNAPFFKNQGDCVSYVQSNSNAIGNKTK